MSGMAKLMKGTENMANRILFSILQYYSEQTHLWIFMEITKEIVNQKQFKITKSGTFTKETKDILASELFRALIEKLKPVNELRKK